MADDIPFDKKLDLKPETVDEAAPGIRRILCANPGPFTFTGTLTYIVGRGRVAIIDPGPANETHIATLLNAVKGETVTHIFVTHTHRDHSPAVRAVKAATGAKVFAEGPHRAARPLHIGELDTESDDPAGVFRVSGQFTPHTALFNVSGQPAVSLPLFHGDDGLPTPVQFAGPPAGEAVLLSLAAQLEDARPWADRRPPIG